MPNKVLVIVNVPVSLKIVNIELLFSTKNSITLKLKISSATKDLSSSGKLKNHAFVIYRVETFFSM